MQRIPPRTTPECERLLQMVIEGLKANIFDDSKREAARAALKRLYDKRCFKAIEYVIQVSCDSNPLDTFAHEICGTATRYLNELAR
jgi:hypothetical protein